MQIGFSTLSSALGRIFYEKDYAGDNHYTIEEANNWYEATNDLLIAQDHPLLTGGMLFVSNLFAQAQFVVKNKKTGKPIENHWLLTLLNNPNYYQTRIDFLESTQFMKLARGAAVIWKKRGIGNYQPTALYLLDPALFTWPTGYKTEMGFNGPSVKTAIYDKDGPQETRVNMDELIWLYDMPNCLNKQNFFYNGSRISSIKQTLYNTKDSEIAKNIILKSNGKEMISADGTDGMMLDENEAKEAKNMFNIGYGLSKTRSRSFITNKNIKWKSLHIALRDLGLDESIKVDGNIIFTALHIPKDILSLEAKKTTYNNYRESMTSYIQNDTQSQMNDLTESLKELLDDNEIIEGTYDHLPVMQFLEKEKYEGISLRAKALDDLINAGIPEDIAKEMCGFPKNMKLDEEARSNASGTGSSPESTESKGIGSHLRKAE